MERIEKTITGAPNGTRRATRLLTAGAAVAGLAISGAALGGCGGSAITPELRDARAAVAEAREGSAARLKPDDVLVATRTLARAEAAPDASIQEADLAYVAERQAQMAMAEARAVELEQQVARDRARYRVGLESLARARGEQIEETERRLAEQRRVLAERERMLAEQRRTVAEQRRTVAEQERMIEEQTEAVVDQQEMIEQQRQTVAMQQEAALEQQRAIEQTREQLEAERQARLEAERRAQQSMERLRELASVRQERDETVITLSGEVLFESDRAQLLPTARERLLAVADALRATPDQRVVIEGHTDSRGSDEYNRRLSQDRAAAVREYLIAEGVPAARMQAVGLGESQPLAGNDDAEGRALNRRVELHLRSLVVPTAPSTRPAPAESAPSR